MERVAEPISKGKSVVVLLRRQRAR